MEAEEAPPPAVAPAENNIGGNEDYIGTNTATPSAGTAGGAAAAASDAPAAAAAFRWASLHQSKFQHNQDDEGLDEEPAASAGIGGAGTATLAASPNAGSRITAAGAGAHASGAAAAASAATPATGAAASDTPVPAAFTPARRHDYSKIESHREQLSQLQDPKYDGRMVRYSEDIQLYQWALRMIRGDFDGRCSELEGYDDIKSRVLEINEADDKYSIKKKTVNSNYSKIESHRERLSQLQDSKYDGRMVKAAEDKQLYQWAWKMVIGEFDGRCSELEGYDDIKSRVRTINEADDKYSIGLIKKKRAKKAKKHLSEQELKSLMLFVDDKLPRILEENVNLGYHRGVEKARAMWNTASNEERSKYVAMAEAAEEKLLLWADAGKAAAAATNANEEKSIDGRPPVGTTDWLSYTKEKIRYRTNRTNLSKRSATKTGRKRRSGSISQEAEDYLNISKSKRSKSSAPTKSGPVSTTVAELVNSSTAARPMKMPSGPMPNQLPALFDAPENPMMKDGAGQPRLPALCTLVPVLVAPCSEFYPRSSGANAVPSELLSKLQGLYSQSEEDISEGLSLCSIECAFSSASEDGWLTFLMVSRKEMRYGEMKWGKYVPSPSRRESGHVHTKKTYSHSDWNKIRLVPLFLRGGLVVYKDMNHTDRMFVLPSCLKRFNVDLEDYDVLQCRIHLSSCVQELLGNALDEKFDDYNARWFHYQAKDGDSNWTVAAGLGQNKGNGSHGFRLPGGDTFCYYHLADLIATGISSINGNKDSSHVRGGSGEFISLSIAEYQLGFDCYSGLLSAAGRGNLDGYSWKRGREEMETIAEEAAVECPADLFPARSGIVEPELNDASEMVSI